MTLEQKIEQERRKRKYRGIIKRLRLRYFEYEDESPEKAEKSLRLIEKIRANVLKPCPCCGAD